jgi:hypothetical protein
MLEFGPDGYLYVGTGDGRNTGVGSGLPAQDKNNDLGKILRLDVDNGTPFAIPPTNPFVGQSGVKQEIWAYGLRNPWRFSFDRATGDLWIGDVGERTLEEINLHRAGSPAGRNFGWNIMEGMHCVAVSCNQNGLRLPIAEYDHSMGCAVVGGYVYRGAAMPALRGAYIFSDYCTGRIWSLRQDGGGSWVRTQLLDTPYSISSFGEDEAGALYLVAISNGGGIFRFVDPATPTITPTPGTPTATPTATNTQTTGSSAAPDLTITAFSATPAPSNRPIPLSVTVRNQGDASTVATEGFDVHVFADLGRPPTRETFWLSDIWPSRASRRVPRRRSQGSCTPTLCLQASILCGLSQTAMTPRTSARRATTRPVYL